MPALLREETKKLWGRRAWLLMLTTLLLVSLILFLNGMLAPVPPAEPPPDAVAEDAVAEDAALSFHERLESRLQNEKKKLLISIFDDAWQQARTTREIELLTPLLAIEASDADDRAYRHALAAPFRDIFLIVLLWLLLDALFFEDDRLRTNDLLQVTAAGTQRVFAAKLVVFAVSLLALVALFGGSVLLAGAAFNRLPDLPVQMVTGFDGVFLPQSAVGFFLFLSLGQYMTLLLLGLFLLFLMRLLRRPATALTIFAIAHGASAGLFYFIPPSSRFILLRYLNPVAFLSPLDGLSRLTLFNLAGQPVTFPELWLAAAGLGLVLLVPAAFWANGRAQQVRSLKLKRRTPSPGRSCLAHHASILLVVQRGGVILLVFGLLFGYRLYAGMRDAEDYRAAEHAAMRIYGGEMNAATREALTRREEDERQLLTAIAAERQKVGRPAEADTRLNELLAAYERLPGREGFGQMMHTLDARLADRKTWLLPERGFAFIFGVYHDLALRSDFLLSAGIFVLFVAFANDFFFKDRRHDLILATPLGRQPFFRHVLLCLVAAAAVFVLVPDITRLITTNASSPLLFWHAPVSEISDVASALPLWLLLGLRLGFALLLHVALGLLVLLLELRASREAALAVGIGGVLILWLLPELGLGALSFLSLTTFALVRTPASSVPLAAALVALTLAGIWRLRRRLTLSHEWRVSHEPSDD